MTLALLIEAIEKALATSKPAAPPLHRGLKGLIKRLLTPSESRESYRNRVGQALDTINLEGMPGAQLYSLFFNLLDNDSQIANDLRIALERTSVVKSTDALANNLRQSLRISANTHLQCNCLRRIDSAADEWPGDVSPMLRLKRLVSAAGFTIQSHPSEVLNEQFARDLREILTRYYMNKWPKDVA